MRRSSLASIVLLIVTALASSASAATKRSLLITPDVALKVRPSSSNFVCGLVSGPPWSTEFAFAGQLAALASLNQEGGPHGESGPRLAPLVAEIGSRNISDLLTNSTTDLAMVPLPALARAKRERPGITSRIGYVAPLYLQEVHVVARNDVDDLSKLRHRRVALGGPDGIGAMLFQALDIDVEPIDLASDVALWRLAAGDVDAVVIVSGKPVSALAGIAADKGLRLVPIPYTDDLQGDFLPTELTSTDYPGLVRTETTPTPSLAVQSVLAAYLWPQKSERAQLLATLVTGVLDHVGDPSADFGAPKLRDVNWAATLPGWTRLAAAQTWLDRHERARQDVTGVTVQTKEKH